MSKYKNAPQSLYMTCNIFGCCCMFYFLREKIENTTNMQTNCNKTSGFLPIKNALPPLSSKHYVLQQHFLQFPFLWQKATHTHTKITTLFSPLYHACFSKFTSYKFYDFLNFQSTRETAPILSFIKCSFLPKDGASCLLQIELKRHL